MTAAAVTAGLLVAALAVALVAGWRRARAERLPAAREIEGPTCYPRVKR